jgi:site-specific recombinase XerC
VTEHIATMTEPLLTRSQWAAIMRAPLRDKSYQLTGLGAAVTDFLAWKRLDVAAERTLDQYERDLSRACVLYPEKTLEALTSEDLLHVVSSFPPRSQKRARAALASMFRWAILWGRIEKNPMDRVPRAAQPPGRYVEVFTEAELAALTSLDDLRDRTLMTILIDAGLRKGEARNLRSERCLLETRQLVVVGGKGGKDRVIPMSERLTSVLADLFLTDGVEPDQFVWYGRGGNQHGHMSVSRSSAIGEGTFHRWWGVRSRTQASATATRTPLVTRSPPGCCGGAGAWRRSRRRWGTPRSPTTVDLDGHLDVADIARDLAVVESGVGINPQHREDSWGIRRGPDSNRCTRLCRPLPNLSATAPARLPS